MSDQPYITCRELIEFLMDYLSGELPAKRRAEFERHLAVCPACVSYMQNYEITIRLGRMAGDGLDEPVGGEVPEELVQAILKARRE